MALDLSPAEVAWLAGIIEGEGCIYFMKRKGKHCHVCVVINMTDYDIIERVNALVPGSVNEIKKREEHHKQAWTWQLARRAAVEEFLIVILPWLGERRGAKAREALEFIESFKEQPCLA